MTRVLYLDIPAPCEFLTSNKRPHRMEKARLSRIWRMAGKLAVPRGTEPFTGRVRIEAHIWKPVANTYDPNNWHDTTKPIVDGLVDAGLFPNDDHTRVLGPDHRHGGKGSERIVLTIEELT